MDLPLTDEEIVPKKFLAQHHIAQEVAKMKFPSSHTMLSVTCSEPGSKEE